MWVVHLQREGYGVTMYDVTDRQLNAIKAQYKTLVKRFHPDANGGDRSFEERLRDIIRAHDVLRAAGLC